MKPDQWANPKKTDHAHRKQLSVFVIVLIVFLTIIIFFCPKQFLSADRSEDGTYYAGLVISEIMASNHTAVPDENGEYHDWIEIWNSSDHTINLQNVGLSDNGESIKFLFPKMMMEADARLVVFCSGTNQTHSDRAIHADFKLSSSGETIYLYQPSAYLIDAVTYRIIGTDTVWALQENGQFAETNLFSPGYANDESGHQAYQTANMLMDGALIINEICPNPLSGLADEDGDYVDWIELYNTTDQTISLNGYALSDKVNKPLMWRFPDNAIILPHGYYLVFCSGKDRSDDPTEIPHTNFKISSEHDTIVLSDLRGRVVDRVIVDNIPDDCSLARQDNRSYTVMPMSTPSLPNTEEGVWTMDAYIRHMNPTGVYISEVMASNHSTSIAGTTDTCDWVELYNPTDVMVDLSNYGFSDHIGRPRRWQFPQGMSIAPHSYLTVYCDGKEELTTTSSLHTNFKLKRSGGEVICLSDATGKVIDKLNLPEIPTDISYGRTQSITGFCYYRAGTPGTDNNTAEWFRGYAEAPELTVAPGLHYGTVNVALTIPDHCQVYYTTDGSIPTQSSTPYTGQTFELNYTTVLRARAFSDDDLDPSAIMTGTYFVNTYHTLPVVSLVADPDELWNPENGMLVAGSNIDKSRGIPFKNAIYRQFGKVEREGHVEVYLQDGTTLLNQGMEFGLQGEYSLDMPQKSFKLRARSSYGSKYFNAKLFDDREYTMYRCFSLRNSGNDCVWTRLVDGFQSRLLDDYGATILHQAWNPVVVYLNGVYWGHYNMRERVDQYFVAQHEGVSFDDADSITILEGNGSLHSGSNSVRQEYHTMIKRIKNSHPAENPEDLQYILDNIDVDNYLEYMALLMFVGESDTGNIRYYRIDYPDGTHSKWRWIWYDKDYGFFKSTFNSPVSYTRTIGMGEQKIDNTLFLKLLEVPEYRDRYFRKLGSVYRLFTTEHMMSVLLPLIEQIEPEMNIHFNRWGEENDPAIIAEAPRSVDGAYRYWQQRIKRLQNTLKKRPNLLWGYIKDGFGLTNAEMVEYFGEQPVMPEDAI